MNKKIIVLSFLLLNLKMICGENPVAQLKVPCFEISYSDKRVNELSFPGFRHSKYGFESNPLTLTYYKERELGVVSLNGKVLQRLLITKQQFSKINGEIKDGSSIAKLEFNKEFPLKSPLYIVTQESNQFILYKINWFKNIQFSEVDKAICNFDRESVVDITQQSLLFGIGIGTISAILLMCVVKKFYYS
jgi:hypothetical protein